MKPMLRLENGAAHTPFAALKRDSKEYLILIL